MILEINKEFLNFLRVQSRNTRALRSCVEQEFLEYRNSWAAVCVCAGGMGAMAAAGNQHQWCGLIEGG